MYPYITLTANSVMTLLRGRVAMEDGRVTGTPADGRFLPRALSPYAVPGQAAPPIR